MSFVHKIPPLISALAFGYGVGMAAPEDSLDQVKGALAPQRPVAGRQAPVRYQPINPALEARLAGEESKALRELREGREPGRYAELAESRDLSGGYSSDRKATRTYEDETTADEFEAMESTAVSRLQLPDLGLGVSRQTLKYVRFFTKTDRGRNMFETWLKRSGRYQEMIQEELRARRLPEDLIWVAMIESGFDATARSPVGATGLWQFMPATGAVYGLKQNKYVDQRRNAKLATQAAAHHLRDLYMRFGQWDLALASYNMGYEQLLDRIDRVGTTDFNELVRAGVMPSETSKYVPKIIAVAIVANNLERFGFEEVKLQAPVDGAELSVPERTPLEVIAKSAGVSTSVIRKLNPDILGKELPPGKGEYVISVPVEGLSRAVASLPAMLEVNRGRLDDASVIDPLDLMSPDGYRPRASAEENLLALLPKPKKKKRTMRNSLLGDDEFAARLDGLAALEDEGRSESKRNKRETVLYRVTTGDTLLGVARQFATDLDDVARDNGLEPGAALREGTMLRLNVRPDIVNGASGGEKKDAKNDEKREKSPAKKAKKG